MAFCNCGIALHFNESKSSLRKTRCASEIKQIKLRILHCALLRCAFDLMLFVPTSVISQKWLPQVKSDIKIHCLLVLLKTKQTILKASTPLISMAHM